MTCPKCASPNLWATLEGHVQCRNCGHVVVDVVDGPPRRDFRTFQEAEDYIATLTAERDEAKRDCAQFCGDNERLIKATGQETVERALWRIAHDQRNIDSLLIDVRRLESERDEARLERDDLVNQYADLSGSDDRTYLHASLHLRPLILNTRADAATERVLREQAESSAARLRAALAGLVDDLEAIIDRAQVGKSIAILQDEAENFQYNIDNGQRALATARLALADAPSSGVMPGASCRVGQFASDRQDGQHGLEPSPGLPIDDAPSECLWIERKDGNWQTGCGKCAAYATKLVFCADGEFEEQPMRFCFDCGQPLRVADAMKGGER